MQNEVRNLIVKITGDATGLKKATDQVAGSSSSFDKFKSAANAGAIALAGIGTGLTLYAKNATDFATQYVKDAKQLSRITGDTVENASQLEYVTRRLGISADKTALTMGIFAKAINNANNTSEDEAIKQQTLANNIAKTEAKIKTLTDAEKKHGDASGDTKRQIDGLNLSLQKMQSQVDSAKNPLLNLGVAMKNADGTAKSFNDVLLETADKFKAMPDGATKTAIAMQLFGRSGKDMIKVLNLGSQGIQDLETQADKLGLTLSEKNVSQVSKYIESQKKLKDSTDSLKLAVGVETAPVLADFNIKVNNIIQSLLGTQGPLRSLTVDVLAFGGPVASASAGLLAFAAHAGTLISMLPAGALAMGGWAVAAAGVSFAIASLSQKVAQNASQGDIFSAKAMTQTSALQLMAGALLPLAPLWANLSGYIFGASVRADQHKAALQGLKAAQDAEKLSTDALAASQLAATGAALGVEQAQKNYTDAVNQYGPQSLEARTAAYNLAQAQNDLKAAHDRVTDSQQKQADKADAVKKANQTVQDSTRNTSKAVSDSGGVWDSLANKIDNFVKGVSGKRSILNPLGIKIPGFAQGVEGFGGGLAVVGEQGPELVNLPKGSDVIPMSTAPAAQTTQPSQTHIEINVSAGMFLGTPNELRAFGDKIWRELSRSAKAQGVFLPQWGTPIQ